MSVHSVDIGTDHEGARFTFTRETGYHYAGLLEIDVWRAKWDEAASVTVSYDEMLTLAQELDDWLDR